MSVHQLGDVSGEPPVPPEATARYGSGGNNGGGIDARLRELEIQVARIDERGAAMQENMAKKNDVTGLKVWILGGVLSAIIIAAIIAATVVKAFFSTTVT